MYIFKGEESKVCVISLKICPKDKKQTIFLYTNIYIFMHFDFIWYQFIHAFWFCVRKQKIILSYLVKFLFMQLEFMEYELVWFWSGYLPAIYSIRHYTIKVDWSFIFRTNTPIQDKQIRRKFFTTSFSYIYRTLLLVN